MPGLTVHFEVLNQLNSPALYADTLANRPAAQIVGRIFFRTDSPFGIYRDTGTAWDLIASPDTTGITGTLAAGQVPYATGTATVAGTNNLFFDSTNNRLGINTASPGVPLDVHGTGTQMQLNGTGTNNSFLVFQNAGTSKWRIGNNYSAGTNYFSIYDNTNAIETLKITPGTTNAILFTGNLTATTLIKSGGTSSQFLKADGSIDSNTYITTSTNIYNTDGTLTSNRTLTNGGFNFSIVGSTYTNRFTSAGRLLLGTTTEGTFLLDVNADARINTLRIGLGNNNQANNTCIGLNALNAITTGQQHTAIGSGALQSQTTSFSSIAIGYLAANAVTTSGFNTIVGTQAMQSGNGANNTIIGSSSGQTNSGSSNTFVGNSVGKNISGSFNIGIGATNFSNASANSGTYNIAIGQDIMTAIVSGTGNTAIQYASLGLITSGGYNVAVGRYTGYNLTTGSNNTLIGDKSGLGLTTTTYNTFIGSLFNTTTGNGITTGSFNTIIGSQITGLSTTLANNIIISDGAGNMRIVTDNNGNSFFGATTTYPTINASAIIQADSTTKGFLLPRMTTTQKNAISSPAQGLIVFDTTLIKLCVYSGTAWETVTSI
jgi:hypothetical protein